MSEELDRSSRHRREMQHRLTAQNMADRVGGDGGVYRLWNPSEIAETSAEDDLAENGGELAINTFRERAAHMAALMDAGVEDYDWLPLDAQRRVDALAMVLVKAAEFAATVRDDIDQILHPEPLPTTTAPTIKIRHLRVLRPGVD